MAGGRTIIQEGHGDGEVRRRLTRAWALGALALVAACAGDPPEVAIPRPSEASAQAAPHAPLFVPPSKSVATATAAATAWPEPGGPALPRDRLVDRLIVRKGERRLYAVIGETPVKAYRIALGFSPVGHKAFEGDGRTPEGRYTIDRKNANSDFHLSLGVSYPNAEDRARARALGVSAGGNIMIHGLPDDDPFGYAVAHPQRDWTWGCIAVTNREIEELWRAVPHGAPIVIEP